MLLCTTHAHTHTHTRAHVLAHHQFIHSSINPSINQSMRAPLLRRICQAGADANAGDYDRRTALHIAAAEDNLNAVRV